MATKKSATKTVAKAPAKKIAAKKSAARKLSSTPPPTSTPTSLANSADAVDAQLARYRSMRDFGVTAEPSGAAPEPEKGAQHPFCIQKHAASHLHYDFRLGWNGVLKSWACAKGPSYVVKEKRLAIQVEDHPMEYGGFEGIIPAGQYGGGTVMLWDQGTWAPQPGHEDVDAGLREGQLKFTLQGSKMHGKWALIRMAPRPKETKPAWLLIKEHDSFEQPPTAPAITDSEPNSVITGRSLEQIAANQDHTWNSKETAGPGQAWHRNDPASKPVPEVKAATHQHESADLAADLSHSLEALPEEHQPTFLKPQLAQETETPPEGPTWLHELKLDGYRMQARKEGTKVQLLTRTGIDWTERMRHVAAEIARLPIDVTLDGEVVVLAENGTTSFADLQASMQEGARNPLTYFAFDLLHIAGRNPRELPLTERKDLLAKVLKQSDPDHLQFSEHLTGNGLAMFKKACELRAEGIISKRATAPYLAGRSSSWVKSKCLHEQEFVIGGYTLPGKGKAGGPGIGALLLGYYEEANAGPGKPGQPGNLIYAGRTGTGFTQKFSVELRKRLEPAETSVTPFRNPSTEARKGAIWVRPSTVAQVRFATWTADNQLRQAAFLGLREDKPASEVRRETAAPTPKSDENKSRVTHPSAPSLKNGVSPATDGPHPAPDAAPLPHPPIRLTHPAKVLDPTSKLTKQQLADYYYAVAPAMLPHLLGRAVSLVRLPNGIGQESFYQKNVSATLPAGFESVPVPDGKTDEIHQYVTLSTSEAIASLAQMSVLEVHPWGSLASDLEHPDRLIIDLDPDESLPWSIVVTAALDVRAQLKKIGLESWVKTTGGKGLHVVLPIQPNLAWPEIKAFCHAFVKRVAATNPALYLTVMTKAARTGKIYLDYLRNERGATAIAPFSPRARANAPCAVPLAWSELTTGPYTQARPTFTIANFPSWQPRLNSDPWAKLPTTHQPITSEARRTLGLK